MMYLRLSLEDEEVDSTGRDESNSITNQRRILNDYLTSHPELGSDFEEIVDDGFSGTNFQRPGMTELLKLVEAGEVGTILVKDLSRFGRNYLEAGYYIELVFPVYQVRLIAVNDYYDSARTEGSAGDISLALNNIKNEMYSRDISAKQRSVLDYKRKNGEYTGQVPFGYLASPAKHSHVIDERAANVVREIFRLAAEEQFKTIQIARHLNAEGYLSPSAYRAKYRGYKGKVQTFWAANSVYRVLINRFYTGSFDQYKMHANAIGSKHSIKIPKSKRIVMHNTHEAIVSEEVFHKAQNVLICRDENAHRKPRKRPVEAMLAQYLYCGCCARRLHLSHWGDTHYECHSARWRVDGECNQVVCDAVELESVVYHAIENLIQLGSQIEQKNSVARQKAEEAESTIQNAIRSLKQKRKRINLRKIELYEQMKSGQLSLQGFKDAKQVCNLEEEAIEGLMEEKMKELAGTRAERIVLAESAEQCALPAINDDHLTPGLLNTFVQKIIIYPSKEPEIVFKTANVFHK
jgi:DNA invertase Pin-like site-specific DNA recombinase